MRYFSKLVILLIFSLFASLGFAEDLDPNFDVRWKFVQVSNEDAVSYNFIENKFLIEPIALDAKTSLGITQDGIYLIPADGNLCFMAIRFPLNYKINLDELRIVRAVKHLNINASRSDFPNAVEEMIADFHFAAVQGKDMFIASRARHYMLKSELVRRYFAGKKPILPAVLDLSYSRVLDHISPDKNTDQHRSKSQKCGIALLEMQDRWEETFVKSQRE